MRKVRKGPDVEIDPDTFLREVHLFLDEEFNYPQMSEGNETSRNGRPPGGHGKTKAFQEVLLSGYVRDVLPTVGNKNSMC